MTTKIQPLKNYSFICPNCKEKQISVTRWETVSLPFLFDLKTKESIQNDPEGSDFENYTCPSCFEDIEDKKLILQLEEHLFS